MNRFSLTVISTLSSSLLVPVATAAPPTCEDVPSGTAYVEGDTFTSDGVPVRFECFQLPGGDGFCQGGARIEPPHVGCNSGQRLALESINARFDYLGSIGARTNPVFTFGEFGGNINLSINGDSRNFANFLDIDGTFIGGCIARVLAGGTGNDCGRIRFEGVVNRLTVGGREFWWDGTPDCAIGFDDLPLGSVYPALGSLSVEGVPMTVLPLLNPSTAPIFGEAVVGSAGLACVEGHELLTHDCRVGFNFGDGPGRVRTIALQFGEYGGHINLGINGHRTIVENFRDLPHLLGGATLDVLDGGFGGDCGRLLITGPVNRLEIGGRQLWIDCIDYELDPTDGGSPEGFECDNPLIDHSDLPLAGVWTWGDTIWTGGAKVRFVQYLANPDSHEAYTSEENLACGDDRELGLFNMEATYDFSSIGMLYNVRVLVTERGDSVMVGGHLPPDMFDPERDFIDLHDVVHSPYGGRVKIESGGNDGECTVLLFEGPIDTFFIASDRVVIDCIWAEQILVYGDLDGNGCVDSADIGMLLGSWGTPDADLDRDGTTDAADMGILLGNWGC